MRGVSSSTDMNTNTALGLVSSFFPLEWGTSSPADVHLKQITGGFVNRLYLLSRSSTASSEPPRILIRLLGLGPDIEEPTDSPTNLSSSEQALVYYEMGRRGWGPKLYGVFKGGRLEEWIDAHTMTPEEAGRDDTRRDMAKEYARFHSIDLPLRKTNFEQVIPHLKATARKGKETATIFRVSGMPQKQAFGNALDLTDWAAELDWVESLFKRYDCKTSLALGDANYLNVLVKNYESECRVMLIDYETATYGYRGIDIGGHFTERQYAWSAPQSQLTGCPLPSTEEERSLCQSYLDEMVELGVEMDERDTLDHLWLEAKIGQLYQILFSVLMCGSFEWMEDIWLLEGLTHMLETYKGLKREFVEAHGESDVR